MMARLISVFGDFMPGATQASTAARGNEGLKISAKLRQILGGGTRRIVGSKIAATLDKTHAAT
jgi:hypothetical protein